MEHLSKLDVSFPSMKFGNISELFKKTPSQLDSEEVIVVQPNPTYVVEPIISPDLHTVFMDASVQTDEIQEVATQTEVEKEIQVPNRLCFFPPGPKASDLETFDESTFSIENARELMRSNMEYVPESTIRHFLILKKILFGNAFESHEKMVLFKKRVLWGIQKASQQGYSSWKWVSLSSRNESQHFTIQIFGRSFGEVFTPASLYAIHEINRLLKEVGLHGFWSGHFTEYETYLRTDHTLIWYISWADKPQEYPHKLPRFI